MPPTGPDDPRRATASVDPITFPDIAASAVADLARRIAGAIDDELRQRASARAAARIDWVGRHRATFDTTTTRLDIGLTDARDALTRLTHSIDRAREASVGENRRRAARRAELEAQRAAAAAAQRHDEIGAAP